MINSVAEDSNSAVTTAYELLCTSHPNTIERSVTSYVTNAAENGEVPKNIDDFADQCDFIIGKLKAGFD